MNYVRVQNQNELAKGREKDARILQSINHEIQNL